MTLLNSKVANMFIQILSKVSHYETIKLIISILSLMGRSNECREELIMNSCIEETNRIFKTLDQDYLKVIFIQILANCGENELGLNKIKRFGLVSQLYEASKKIRNKSLSYHIAMAFLIFCKDNDIYHYLTKNKFIMMFENMNLSQVKEEEDLEALLFGFTLFTKKSTESNLSELFLVN